MKHKIIFVLFFLILFMSFVSPVEFEMKQDLNQGETLMAKVSGNFLDNIGLENIYFYKEHVRVPIEYDVAEIDDEFYIYALLGNKPGGNYSINIKDVRYYVGSQITDDDIIKNFTITNETADFDINPGFVLTDEDFSIRVQNLKEYGITIEIIENSTGESSVGFFDFLFGDGSESDNSVDFKSGEVKNLEFGLGDETSFRFIELKTDSLSYLVPVYAFVYSDSESQTQGQNGTDNTNQTSDGTSVGNETNKTDESRDSNVSETGIKSATTKTCEQLNGIFCGESEECTDEISTYAKDGICCLNTCEKIKKSSTGKIIGWSLFGVIVILFLWFVAKRKPKRKEIDLFKISKGKK